MVFLEQHQIGWLALIKSFIKRIPKSLEKSKDFIFSKIKWISDCSLAWVKRYGKCPVYGSEMPIINNLLKILSTYLEEYNLENCKVPKEIDDIIANSILFSCIWSIGAALEETSRKQFNAFISKLILGDSTIVKDLKLDLKYDFEPQVISSKLPDQTNLFEMVYEKTRQIWIAWT